MTSAVFSRRTLLGAALCAAALQPFGAARAADDKGDPFEFILAVSNEILDAIRADAKVREGDVQRVRELVDTKVMPVVDFQMMTRMTVGPKWRQATAEQKKALQEGFEDLLLRVYSGALSAVKDHRVELRPTRNKAVKDEMVIRTLLKSAGQADIGLDYRIYRNKEKAWKIVDVNVEGIWMVENYRSQFASILSQDGIDGLIAEMKKKDSKLGAEPAKAKAS